jgi:hypothetical protein
MFISLSDENDAFMWRLTTFGSFLVKSMYPDYMNGHTIFLRKYIWKLEIPLKVHIFMWFLHKKVILTKDNLARRNWKGCKKCVFCDSLESINHLFFDCPFAKLIWRVIQFTFNIPHRLMSQTCSGTKVRIRIYFSASMWAIWNNHNDIVFNMNRNVNFFTDYPYGITLDPRLVFLTAGGAMRAGGTSYLQPG